MSFAIWAIGNSADPDRKFHFPKRTKLDEGDVYDAAKALGQAPGTGGGLTSPGFTQLMNMAGTLTVLNQAMTQLKLARAGGNDTQLWFTTYRDRQFYRSKRLYLTGDVKTDRDFLREMTKLGINRWGILRGTLGVFGEWTRFTNAHGWGDPSALVFGVDIRTG